MFGAGGDTVSGLTERQRQVLDYIRRATRRDGYPPTVREICTELDLSSPSTVHAHLANLERQGYLRRDPSKPRALELADDFRPPRPLPLVGRVAAGMPLLAEQNVEEYLDVPSVLRKGDDDFVLRVRGDSMANAGILDGDFIVVHQQESAQNGEIVVALVEDEATTKRFFRDDDCVRLEPENDLYEPILLDADAVTVVGRVVGVLRRL